MPKQKPSARSDDRNLLIAIVGLVAFSAVAASATAYICGFVLDSFQDTNAMVMLITDAGTKSDDKNLEKNLSSATLALKACRDLGLALAVGCAGCGLAVGLRLWKQKDV